MNRNSSDNGVGLSNQQMLIPEMQSHGRRFKFPPAAAGPYGQSVRLRGMDELRNRPYTDQRLRHDFQWRLLRRQVIAPTPAKQLAMAGRPVLRMFFRSSEWARRRFIEGHLQPVHVTFSTMTCVVSARVRQGVSQERGCDDDRNPITHGEGTVSSKRIMLTTICRRRSISSLSPSAKRSRQLAENPVKPGTFAPHFISHDCCDCESYSWRNILHSIWEQNAAGLAGVIPQSKRARLIASQFRPKTARRFPSPADKPSAFRCTFAALS
jgi:hypothetical protein